MYQKIMVPLDGSTLAECVLPHVEAFIKSCLTKTVIFVRVVEPLPLIVYGEVVETFPVAVSDGAYGANPDYWKKVEEERKTAAEEYLKQATSHLRQYGAQIECEVLMGKVSTSLATYAESHAIDMILIATHGRSGVNRWIMGSVADRILQSSHVPVLMVHAPGDSPEGKRQDK